MSPQYYYEAKPDSDSLEQIVSERLRESIDDIRGAMRREDVGWNLIGRDITDDGGPSLRDIKDWSAKHRTSTIAAPWIKRGLSLRAGFVWDGGIQYSGIPEGSRGRRNVNTLKDDVQNRREFFGADAHRKREGRLYHDGFALWIGKNSTKKLESIPLDQIAGELRHPEYPGVIVAYLREWGVYDFGTGESTKKKSYYIVNGYESLFDKLQQVSPSKGAEPIDIDKTYTAFHQHANKMDGFAYGIPDVLAAWIWNNIGRDAYMDGATMTKALASIAFKATSKTKTGGQNAALQFAQARPAGSAAVMGAANDLSVLSSAGKGYDYNSLRGLIATIAAALDLSVVHLTADPGAAGSSYGSAQTLDLPGRITTGARRQEHADLDTEVLVWMGAPDAVARFNTLEDPVQMLRRLQAEVMPWLQGVESPENFQKRAAKALGLADDELGAMPDGVMTPNNENFAASMTNDADPNGTAATPSQGQANGVGADGTNSNDIRSDGIGT